MAVIMDEANSQLEMEMGVSIPPSFSDVSSDDMEIAEEEYLIPESQIMEDDLGLDSQAGSQAQGSQLVITCNRNKRARVRVLPIERLHLVKYATSHAGDYKRSSAEEWNTQLQIEFMVAFKREIECPAKCLNRWTNEYRKVMKERRTLSGIAITRSELDQAMDVWVNMVDDIKNQKAKKAAEKKKQEEDRRKAIAERQDSLMTRWDRRRNNRQVQEQEVPVVTVTPSPAPGARTPYSRSPSRSRSRSRSPTRTPSPAVSTRSNRSRSAQGGARGGRGGARRGDSELLTASLDRIGEAITAIAARPTATSAQYNQLSGRIDITSSQLDRLITALLPQENVGGVGGDEEGGARVDDIDDERPGVLREQ
ncbi:hypothetical protein FQN49_007626 [Arthroderma sp. PD_2]|nr:hypothetical protein FQN49_007626 [Arthroderma sp. PD_2]